MAGRVAAGNTNCAIGRFAVATNEEGSDGKKGSGPVYVMRLPSRRRIERQPVVRVCRLLGINVPKSDAEFLRLVLDGLPVASVQAVIDHLESTRRGAGAIADVAVSRRTLSRRRRERRQLLTADESDRLVRLARIVLLAEDVFGEWSKAVQWLFSGPKQSLAGESPMSALATETGARLVENMLHQIDHGITP
jgi:putative toxin-antitoxin system antitoxin component (TIGR02293 family)